MVTSTRADWGLLCPVAQALKEDERCELQIVATNMHLMEEYGMTVNEIEADGFKVDERVYMQPGSQADNPAAAVADSRIEAAQGAGRCTAGMAEALGRLRPDVVVVLGDRYEILAAALSATLLNIPIAHISGGEITQGAIDDNIRHALTKLSALHFASTEPYRRRIIQMGENPERVFNTGALGVWNAVNLPKMSREELEASVGWPMNQNTLLVTYHPATLEQRPAVELFRQLVRVLDSYPICKVLFTYPNNDPQGRDLIRRLELYVRNDPERYKAVKSLGRLRYLSALQYVGAVVGNSSSGVVEAPSMGVPVVDIGIRQQGRLRSEAVFHCEEESEAIAGAISRALGWEGTQRAKAFPNPYYQPDTVAKIVEPLLTVSLEALKIKHFYDIQQF